MTVTARIINTVTARIINTARIITDFKPIIVVSRVTLYNFIPELSIRLFSDYNFNINLIINFLPELPALMPWRVVSVTGRDSSE